MGLSDKRVYVWQSKSHPKLLDCVSTIRGFTNPRGSIIRRSVNNPNPNPIPNPNPKT